ncbi:MAG TPA: NADH-quinone oxidoreductase subunit N, partial [Anaeromyxobacteraceae bacterium]|nr:NADH-quinone oxidoreductase subunit N [Anaeromyxobacteraceae bacterium]
MDQLIANNLASMGAFRPELALTFGSVALFLLDLLWRQARRRRLYLTSSTLALLALCAVFLALQPSRSSSLFNGMIATDLFAIFFKWIFLAAAALTVLIVAQGEDFPDAQVGEFYALILSVVVG